MLNSSEHNTQNTAVESNNFTHNNNRAAEEDNLRRLLNSNLLTGNEIGIVAGFQHNTAISRISSDNKFEAARINVNGRTSNIDFWNTMLDACNQQKSEGQFYGRK